MKAGKQRIAKKSNHTRYTITFTAREQGAIKRWLDYKQVSGDISLVLGALRRITKAKGRKKRGLNYKAILRDYRKALDKGSYYLH